MELFGLTCDSYSFKTRTTKPTTLNSFYLDNEFLVRNVFFISYNFLI